MPASLASGAIFGEFVRHSFPWSHKTLRLHLCAGQMCNRLLYSLPTDTSTMPAAGAGSDSHRDWLGDETAPAARLRARGAASTRGFGWLDADGRRSGQAAAAVDHHAHDARLRARRPARAPGLRAARRPRARGDPGHVRGRASTGAGSPRSRTTGRCARRRRRTRTRSSCWPRPAPRSPAARRRPRCSDEIARVVEQRFWSEEEGACLESWDRGWNELEGYRGANANMHMIEAFLAAGDATGDARWYERALRIAERLIRDVASAPRLADPRALRRRLAAAARLQRRPAAPPVPAVRRDAGPRPRVVAPAAPDPRGPRRAARLAGRGRRGPVRAARWPTAGARPAASPTRPTSTGRPSSPIACTGRSRRRSAPPPRCTS